MTESNRPSVDYWSYIRSPAFVVSLFCGVVGFTISQGIQYYKASNDDRQKAISVRVSAFIDSTKEFDALVAVLAHGIMDRNSPDFDARAKLIRNLNQQYSELAQLNGILKADPALAKRYRESLLQLNEELPKVNNVMDMKQYWDSVSTVLKVRRELAEKLRKVASLDTE